MTPLRQLAVARRSWLVLTLTLGVLVACVVWRDQGIVLDYFPPSPPVGLAPDELGSIFLAAFLPAVSSNALSSFERLATPQPRLVLTVYTLGVAVVPATTTIVWTIAVNVSQPLDQVPPVWSRVASFALLGLLGLLLTLAIGTTWGPVLSLVLFSTFVIAQNAYGADFAANALSTGNQWHTNLWIDVLVLLVTVWYAYRSSGVSPRETAHDN